MEAVLIEKGVAATEIRITKTITSIATEIIDVGDIKTQLLNAEAEVQRLNDVLTQAGSAGVIVK